jgi:predicted GIY-YIG superfamily endonuclease
MDRLKILNGHRFTQQSESETSTLTLEREGGTFDVTHSEFATSFRLGFCDSVFRQQGYTLHEPHRILDVDRMNRQDLYTAMSRFKTIDDFELVCTDWDREFLVAKPPEKEEHDRIVTLKRVEVKEGFIYKITDSDGNSYVGQTIKTLEERYREHVKDATSQRMKKWLETNDTEIRLIRTVHFVKQAELNEIEKHHIQQIPRERCMNTIHKQAERVDRGQLTFSTNEERRPPKPKVMPKISDQTQRKRWIIRWRDDNGNGRSKTFGYAATDQSKQDKYREAEQWQAEMYER